MCVCVPSNVINVGHIIYVYQFYLLISNWWLPCFILMTTTTISSAAHGANKNDTLVFNKETNFFTKSAMQFVILYSIGGHVKYIDEHASCPPPRDVSCERTMEDNEDTKLVQFRFLAYGRTYLDNSFSESCNRNQQFKLIIYVCLKNLNVPYRVKVSKWLNQKQ